MFMIHDLWKCARTEDGNIWLIRGCHSTTEYQLLSLSISTAISIGQRPTQPLIVSVTNPIDYADTPWPTPLTTPADVLMVDVVIIAAVIAILSTLLLMLAALIIDCCETNDVSLP